jgi:small GTP-binding protein
MLPAPPPTFRVVMIGDSSVGKTSLLNRLTEDVCNKAESPTVGANWRSWSVEIGGRRVDLQIWDTAGQEKFRALGPLYYRGASAALAVYDIGNRLTFQSLGPWIAAFLEAAGPGMVVVVVANKLDLEDERQITAQEGAAFAQADRFSFMETSAANGQNVKELFVMVCELIERNMQPRKVASPIVVQQNAKCC